MKAENNFKVKKRGWDVSTLHCQHFFQWFSSRNLLKAILFCKLFWFLTPVQTFCNFSDQLCQEPNSDSSLHHLRTHFKCKNSLMQVPFCTISNTTFFPQGIETAILGLAWNVFSNSSDLPDLVLNLLLVSTCNVQW